MALQLWLFRRASGIAPSAVLRCVAPQLAATIVMVLAVLALSHVLSPLGPDSAPVRRILRIGELVTVGAAVYFAALFALIGGDKRRLFYGMLRNPGAALSMI
jgi:peptidoglycan biosynthesis protein MviN/MurJ (putative lipid II flippase)